MKVVIVTVYNSLNPGSFLQATSLYRAIEEMGYDVAFLNTGARDLKKIAKREMMYLLRKFQIKAAIEKKKVANLFECELSAYRVVDEVDYDNDIVVLGSDEIWNVARKEMRDFPVFWGKGLNLERSISYAPSINLATEEDLAKCDFINDCLDRMRAISVRDEYSQKILSKITNNEILRVCDPTILMYDDFYNQVNTEGMIKDYILIYAYNKNFELEDIKAIRKFAKEKNKKILAYGIKQDWCDIYINGTPNDFLRYIKNADYIITGTFHGTMISIIYAKNFIVMGKKKSEKVKQLLAEQKLDREATAQNLEEKLMVTIDIEENQKKLFEQKKIGIEYLKKNIDIICSKK